MVGEVAERIAHCEYDVAAIVGSEAISTVLNLLKRGERPDWSEEVEGAMDDRGYGPERIFEKVWQSHGSKGVIGGYACVDNARRARLGLSPQAYRAKIGELFAPFTEVAAANPHAAAPVERSAGELATITERNRIVAEPYARMTVARDQVNQGAAIILSSVGKAKQLGIPEDRWVYIHASTTADELKVLNRPDLSRSPAAIASIKRALHHSGKAMSDISCMDLYSCFAAPVFNVIDHFEIAPDDPRGLTLTGGLPFFGGAGNNYSAHAIAEAVQRVRKDRGSYALVGANGGVLSKYATGIYSTDPASWNDSVRYDRMSVPQTPEPMTDRPEGIVMVESYTWAEEKEKVISSVIVRDSMGKRALIRADAAHAPTVDLFKGGAPFGAMLSVSRDDSGRHFGRLA
ncbi:acetyl-CoA acetyltransferase [Erythrobacter sp. JK5]|uniref:acetyl-CoA acetyltransferase n=1 Tax=Erythrobacter sp. JK5 TaxID=2829500 RepID=UPI00201280AF|nr:acetyl-CoA acetyltransferase [Erythrobacter sp. JK5]